MEEEGGEVANDDEKGAKAVLEGSQINNTTSA